MDLTERLKAWGAAHARARAAECSAREAAREADAPRLQREAKSLREQADRLHHDIYRDLGRPAKDRRG